MSLKDILWNIRDIFTYKGHEHEWEYRRDNSCEARCKYCGETRMVHPSEIKPGVYSEQICSRCGEQLDSFMNV